MSQLHEIRGCEDPARKLDVVFIHGLGGDPFGTWRHGADESTSWPHWVGDEFRDAGVWTLGYAASPSKLMRFLGWLKIGSRDSGHAMSLPDRARQVADRMVQKGIGKRPLILIGHSLGGLLIKQILRCSADAVDHPHLRTIAGSTRAVLFLATPHTGAVLATLLDCFRTAFGTTVAIETLREHDHHLRDLYEWYRGHAPRLEIETVTYYELRGVAGGTLTIVNPSSSHPGVGRPPVGLDEDHLSVAKPRSRKEQVCDALRELIQTIGQAAVSAPSAPNVAAPISVQPTPVVVRVEMPAHVIATPTHVPHELPPHAEHFVGRAGKVEQLVGRLRACANTAVVGPAGMGKTALAAAALRGIPSAERDTLFPDGIVYLDLYATKANGEATWSRLANRLAGPAFLDSAPPRVRAEAACQGRDLLLIIEGGEEADGGEGRATLPELLAVLTTEATRLLLTRDPTQATSAESIKLDEALLPEDAADLFDTLSGRRLEGVQRQRMLDLLAGHPLALTWAGNLLSRDDEHPETLLRDWTAAQLPPLSDPVNQKHTLRWLFNRSAQRLDADAATLLTAAGLLANVPMSLALLAEALDGGDVRTRTLAGCRSLVRSGLLRIESRMTEHWQFAHVLAHRYARERANDAGTTAAKLALALHEALNSDCSRADDIEIRGRLTRCLDHAASLLGAGALSPDLAQRLLANPLLYDWQIQLLSRGQSDLARGALDAVETWLDGLLAVQIGESDVLRERSVVLNKRGDLLVLQGDLPGAWARYEAALAIAQQLVDANPGNIVWQRDLGITHNKLGDVQSVQGNLPAARARYEAALAIVQRRADTDPGNTESLRDLGVSYNHLGDVQLAQGNLPNARARYEAGLAIAQQLADTDPGNAQWQRDLSISHDKLGVVHSAQGDLPGARSRYEAGLAIAQRLADDDPGNAQWQRDLSVSYDRLGNVQLAQGDLPGARARYEAGLTIAQQLADADPGNAQWQRDLGISHDKLGNVHSAQGDLPSARASYERGRAIAQRLADTDPGNAQWQRDLSVSHDKLGNVQSVQGDLPGARACYEAGLAIRQRLANTDPGNAEWQRDLGVSYHYLGNVQSAQGDLPGARASYEAGLRIAQRLADADPGNTQWQRDLGVSYNQLGNMHSAQGDLRGTRAHYEAGLAIRQQLADADPGNAEWQRDLGISYNQLGNVQSAEGDLPGAQARYEAGLAIAQRLADADPGNTEWQRDLGISHNRLANLQSAQGDLASARASYEAGLAIAQRLADADSGNAQWQRDLSYVLTQMAALVEKVGDIASALGYARASFEIDGRLVALDPTNALFRDDFRVSQRQVERLSQKLTGESSAASSAM